MEYEVLRRTDRGNFERFLHGDEQERTAVARRLEGRMARTREYVLLDPANWVKDEAQTVHVTVEITDERTIDRLYDEIITNFERDDRGRFQVQFNEEFSYPKRYRMASGD